MRDQIERPLAWTGFLLGLSIGGFFDGILLHQVLQWHHLLSNVAAVQDLRTQILADGLFHVLMYVIAAVALYRLWRDRARLAKPGADRTLWGAALMGFGAWHILDALLSHWLIGLHRIRMDAANPLVWDLIWFFAFGVVPAILGWLFIRRRGRGRGSRGRGNTADSSDRSAAAALAMAAVTAGTLAVVPTADPGDRVLVIFAPGVSSSAAFSALAGIDARVLWTDRGGGVWAVALERPADSWKLHRHGALLVSNSALAVGCLPWSRPVGI
ncbi:MAG: DUF2243 domain-containing protein [Burkholderiaceae bacterium]